MRPHGENGEVYYVYGDHLGSTSLTVDDTGSVVSERRYHPFGEERWSLRSEVTDFGFTDQREEISFGLYDYNARYFLPGVGRFVSPDSIVPDFANPQSWNRYSYVYNNPLRYTDPSGHFTEKAIIDYLTETYGDKMIHTLAAWANDEQWWNALRQAQAGDHLFGGEPDTENGFLLRFEGEGQDVLSGFTYEAGYELHQSGLTSPQRGRVSGSAVLSI